MKPITIKTRLDSDVIRLENVEALLGKEVEITIREITEPQPKQWKYSGSVDLGGALDSVNLRDFAHDD